MMEKATSHKPKATSQNLKFWILTCSFAFCLLSLAFTCYAKEITILYTGETHAMIYPCSCPKEPDGGISRRATLIKQLRKTNPHTLVLDSGGLFAGGLMDEYTQNTELDMQRTLVNLKAIELMQYDALSLGDDEFNFGREFLEQNLAKTKIPFLSSNIKSEKLSPYIIKEIAGTKIGIIGVTNLYSMQKAGGLKFIEPKIAVGQAVLDLKKNNAAIIILLSHLGESDDLSLIREVQGIDILIVGHSRVKDEPSGKIDSTLILRPFHQGRRLGKLSLILKDNKIADYKVEELRLRDKISDDPDILSILPRCFSDSDCKKQGMIGRCQEPGALQSQCLFNAASKIPLWVITPKFCSICDTERIVKYLKTQFPGLAIFYLYYPDSKAKKLIKNFDITSLPVYLLGKEIDQERAFSGLKENLEIKGDFYMLKPRFGGISYFLKREQIKGKLDLFISLYDKNTLELLNMIKDFDPKIHFLAVQQQDKLDAAKGNLEVEDYLRAVCVQKYYPQSLWDYINCRAKSINSSWWEDCLMKLDIDKIKLCARGQEGRTLLEENISLNKELEVMFGPTFLLDNQEVFGLQGVPTKEDFKKIIKR